MNLEQVFILNCVLGELTLYETIYVISSKFTPLLWCNGFGNQHEGVVIFTNKCFQWEYLKHTKGVSKGFFVVVGVQNLKFKIKVFQP